MPNYAIVILSEEDEYNILLIRKNGIIYEQTKKKETIHKMLNDKVLVEEDPKLFNIETGIAKFFLKKER